MLVGEIVLRLRAANTSFKNLIAGAAELDLALRATLQKDMAFVMPLFEDAEPNKYDMHVEQQLAERFGIIVALGNDLSQKEKTGIIAFDSLHNIREELFAAIIGWQPTNAEGLVYYRGGKILTVNGAYLFYQFEFEFMSRLQPHKTTKIDLITKEEDQTITYGLGTHDFDYDEKAYDWVSIYANMILAPSSRLPHEGDLPLDDGYPSVRIPDNMAQYIDMQNHPENGAFWRGFGTGFKKYTGD